MIVEHRRPRRPGLGRRLAGEHRAAGRGRSIESLQHRGVRSFVYSNVDRDGMLGGADIDEVCGSPASCAARFIYSGGVGTLDDLRALAELRQVNLGGVIVGKALYEGRFTVAEGQAALKGR